MTATCTAATCPQRQGSPSPSVPLYAPVGDRQKRQDDEQARKTNWAELYPRLAKRSWRKRLAEMDAFYAVGEAGYVRLENIVRGHTIPSWEELARLDQIACEFERSDCQPV